MSFARSMSMRRAPPGRAMLDGPRAIASIGGKLALAA